MAINPRYGGTYRALTAGCQIKPGADNSRMNCNVWIAADEMIQQMPSFSYKTSLY
jgi:hypothetical protein